MSEVTQCPYGDSCPQFVGVSAEMRNLASKMDLQNKFVIEKMEDISSDVKDVKNFLGEKLDQKIDERIEAKLNEKTSKISRWVITSILGSGGLTVLINLLLNK